MAMKVILALLALVVLAQAKHFYWYAGSTTTNNTGLTGNASPTATYVESFDGTTCTLGGVATGYQKFTINSTVGSFWYITALFERAGIYGSTLQIYNGAFDPLAPCTNLRAFTDDWNSDAPHLADLLWLPVGLFDVVITAESLAENGLFAVHADSSFAQHVGSTADPWSEIPYNSATSCTSYGGAPYTWFTVSPTVTGYYDILFYAYNATDTSPYATATLYNGTVSFLGTGNESVPADPCTGQPWVESLYGSSTYTEISKSYYDTGAFMNYHLTGGVNYTVHIVSYYSDEVLNFGIWWRPTVVSQMGNVANYYPPDVPFDAKTDECTPETSTYLWNSHVFFSTYSTVIVDVGEAPGTNFDERTCLYLGINNGTKYTIAPLNCTGALMCGDSGSGYPLSAAGLTGQYFTVVEMPYYSGTGYEGDFYAIWVYSGMQLGPGPAPISSTTGEVSSNAATQIVALVLVVLAMLF